MGKKRDKCRPTSGLSGGYKMGRGKGVARINREHGFIVRCIAKSTSSRESTAKTHQGSVKNGLTEGELTKSNEPLASIWTQYLKIPSPITVGAKVCNGKDWRVYRNANIDDPELHNGSVRGRFHTMPPH